MDLRPFALAARQRELDTAATAAYPFLFERKRLRLLPSPHAFLRGSAPLFYEVLAARPDLADGPPGDGWIVGDMHLENVGAYRTDSDRAVFNLNDFDDATEGPLRLDVLRLATSVLLAGRTFKATGAEAIGLVELAIAGYLDAAWLRADLGAEPLPQPIASMVLKAADRSRKALLDARAPEERSGKRRFVRGDRYVDLDAGTLAAVPALVAAYVTALGERAPAHAAEWQVEDAAMRIAGTGSLGVSRIAVLVRDRGGVARIVELKEARRSAADALLHPGGSPWPIHAERVVAAANGMLVEPTRQLAAVTAGERSFVTRKLFPQEDKLRLTEMPLGPKLDGIVQCIGRILGAAHARGARSRPEAPWSRDDVAALVDRAVEMAGIFEAIYLAYARG